MSKPEVGIKIVEESSKAWGALNSKSKTLPDGTVNEYHVDTWGLANPKVRLHLDGTPNPYFKA